MQQKILNKNSGKTKSRAQRYSDGDVWALKNFTDDDWVEFWKIEEKKDRPALLELMQVIKKEKLKRNSPWRKNTPSKKR